MIIWKPTHAIFIKTTPTVTLQQLEQMIDDLLETEYNSSTTIYFYDVRKDTAFSFVFQRNIMRCGMSL